eukprot:345392-Chlamydomonas_euryale.AAC.1
MRQARAERLRRGRPQRAEAHVERAHEAAHQRRQQCRRQLAVLHLSRVCEGGGMHVRGKGHWVVQRICVGIAVGAGNALTARTAAGMCGRGLYKSSTSHTPRPTPLRPPSHTAISPHASLAKAATLPQATLPPTENHTPHPIPFNPHPAPHTPPAIPAAAATPISDLFTPDPGPTPSTPHPTCEPCRSSDTDQRRPASSVHASLFTEHSNGRTSALRRGVEVWDNG